MKLLSTRMAAAGAGMAILLSASPILAQEAGADTTTETTSADTSMSRQEDVKMRRDEMRMKREEGKEMFEEKKAMKKEEGMEKKAMKKEETMERKEQKMEKRENHIDSKQKRILSVIERVLSHIMKTTQRACDLQTDTDPATCVSNAKAELKTNIDHMIEAAFGG